ncbi:hypothetical protein [Gloeocapsa sp. PCC 73106]|uniref:hypothetical protein n=1 Tax=Gloeocapsa sp. PCC 73106 TaxID=102232 RepID=UPI0002ACA190|nr:hypothetical protein [Gloeocapsa sp. PCC 73106]ELR99170.1 hypothetical protein GLO73106DRAFT_00030190 [Gloeocapsa sp. PCC 73106]
MFKLPKPIIRFKQEELDIQDLCGLLKIYARMGQKTLFYRFYTRIDQVFLLWGIITGVIFTTAHFFPISWHFQAILWSIITLAGSMGMTFLTHFWVTVEQLRWVVYLWIGLMLIGLGITDLGIFGSVGVILINLCPLWLGLTAIGYIVMGLGMSSQTFIVSGLLHFLGIKILPYLAQWQFLITGLIMTSCLLLLAELQWDMRPPIESQFLTSAELEFNRQQNQLRQS